MWKDMTTHQMHLPCLANKYSESVGGGSVGVGGHRRCSKRSAATVIGWFSSRNPAVPPTFAISVADVFDFSVQPSQRSGENEMSLSLSSVAAVAAAEVERMIVLGISDLARSSKGGASCVRSMSNVNALFHFISVIGHRSLWFRWCFCGARFSIRLRGKFEI